MLITLELFLGFSRIFHEQFIVITFIFILQKGAPTVLKYFTYEELIIFFSGEKV